MTGFRGITWDHPRGTTALREAAVLERASGSGLELVWDAQPLEGFEAHPIDELAERYDLIVLDHPHLGDAVRHGSLRPIEEVVSPELLTGWRSNSIGRSYDSYSLDGHQWALPLDAATQVAVRKASLLDVAPTTWAEVEALAAEERVALSIAGPHAFLSMLSVCSAFAKADESDPATGMPARDVASHALGILSTIGSRASREWDALNPIELLHRITITDQIAYCPLVYGYVSYSSTDVQFDDAPSARRGGRHGSILGGTGIAISRGCAVSPELVEHLSWLMSDEAQRHFIPWNQGQPSAEAAWKSESLDRANAGFYGSTIATVRDAILRPRWAGYPEFQSEASVIVRSAVTGGSTVTAAIDHLYAAVARRRTA